MKYRDYLDQLIKCAQAYGIVIGFDGIPRPERPTPVRGAFRVNEIRLPKDNVEEALFVLIHGMGHIAQWTLNPSEQDVSYYYQNKVDHWNDDNLKGLLKHEMAALPLSLGFIEQCGASAICDWYRRYFFADQKYIASIFKHNRYESNIFWKMLGRVRHFLPKKIDRIKSYPFPEVLTDRGREGFIHVI